MVHKRIWKTQNEFKQNKNRLQRLPFAPHLHQGLKSRRFYRSLERYFSGMKSTYRAESAEGLFAALCVCESGTKMGLRYSAHVPWQPPWFHILKCNSEREFDIIFTYTYSLCKMIRTIKEMKRSSLLQWNKYIFVNSKEIIKS